MSKPIASLSLDLDNLWAYLRTHGDSRWEAFPSYLDQVVPRVLDVLAQRGLTITFFVVGQDAALPENRTALRKIVDAGHEIANHSYEHQPWLHLYTREQLAEEFDRAELAIFQATGARPIGFRGPGFSFSHDVHQELASRGYKYDASTFPTFVGPLARAYYLLTGTFTKKEKQDRKQLYGSWREGFRTLRPHLLPGLSAPVIELPVTTMPLLRSPIHLSYLAYLAGYSQRIAKAYFRVALTLCKARGVAPSLLLHPTDFLGQDDQLGLDFFPAMNQSSDTKCKLTGWAIDQLARSFRVVTVAEHAELAAVELAKTHPISSLIVAAQAEPDGGAR